VNEEKESGLKKSRKRFKHRPKMDEKTEQMVRSVEDELLESLTGQKITGLNQFQRKMVFNHFKRASEYRVKSYKDKNEFYLKVFPIGNLKRLAEQKTQVVLMKGAPADLPPMGSFERFVIHDYLKDREGVKTESFGEGADRYIRISPIFGRTLKKVKRKLTI
jgi:predicted RNA-binding protein Jag